MLFCINAADGSSSRDFGLDGDVLKSSRVTPPSISVNTALSSGPLTLQWMITDGERSADITSAQKDARLM